MPAQTMRWAWTSRGLATHEQMAAMHGISVEEMVAHETLVERVHQAYLELEQDPLPEKNPEETHEHTFSVRWR